MTPTEETKKRLRKLLSEVIPEGGKDSDTRFLDTELDVMLEEAPSLYAAAAVGWTQKAGLIQSELGQIEQYSVGQETYKVVNLQTALRSALDMADRYTKMASSSVGSIVLPVVSPEVL